MQENKETSRTARPDSRPSSPDAVDTTPPTPPGRPPVRQARTYTPSAERRAQIARMAAEAEREEAGERQRGLGHRILQKGFRKGNHSPEEKKGLSPEEDSSPDSMPIPPEKQADGDSSIYTPSQESRAKITRMIAGDGQEGMAEKSGEPATPVADQPTVPPPDAGEVDSPGRVKKGKGKRNNSFTDGISDIDSPSDGESEITYTPRIRSESLLSDPDAFSGGIGSGMSGSGSSGRRNNTDSEASVGEPGEPGDRWSGNSVRGRRESRENRQVRNVPEGSRERRGGFGAGLAGGHTRPNPGWSARRFAWVLAVCWVAAILQASLFSRVPVLGMRPDVLAVAVALIAWKCGPAWGGVAGVTGGFIYDVLATLGFAISPLLLFLFGVGVGFLAGRWRANWLSYLLCQLLTQLLLALSRAALAGKTEEIPSVLIGTMLFTMAAYALVAKLTRKPSGGP